MEHCDWSCLKSDIQHEVPYVLRTQVWLFPGSGLMYFALREAEVLIGYIVPYIETSLVIWGRGASSSSCINIGLTNVGFSWDRHALRVGNAKVSLI